MRAADADRERVLEVVRQGHAEGRLSTPEFYERLDAVYQAKTYEELEKLVVDLPPAGTPMQSPVPQPAAAVSRPEPVRSSTRMPSELRGLRATWATVVSINLVIWLILAAGQGDNPYFWPIWVAGPWGVVNLGITLTWWLNRNSDDGRPPALPPGS
jgi:hypothetical protein